ncbi:MAG: hypothetical protein WA672_12840 [Candidatus Angelobacter sp.]
MIAPDAHSSPSTFLPYASLAVAALAVVVGPFIQRAVAKQQLLGPMRQAWINDLRKRISELVATCERLVFTSQFVPDKYQQYSRIAELIGEIELSLNPQEKEHNALVAELRTMSLCASNIAKVEREGTQLENQHSYSTAKNNVFNISKQVFKAEWEVIKGWRRIRRLWRKAVRKDKAF